MLGKTSKAVSWGHIGQQKCVGLIWNFPSCLFLSPHLESGRMQGSKKELPVSRDDKDKEERGKGRGDKGEVGMNVW